MTRCQKTNIQVRESVQDLKMEIETIDKTQTDKILEMESLGRLTGTISTSIIKRIQTMEERISGIEDTIEEISSSVKENV
jgi:predicted  nucleic acid-binding Zn-ribbon protein